MQTKTNNINKTSDILQTTWSKDERDIVLCGNRLHGLVSTTPPFPPLIHRFRRKTVITHDKISAKVQIHKDQYICKLQF